MNVDAFMHANHQLGQSASVQGVVAKIDASKQMIALIDRDEYEECSSTTCAALYLPVRWTGTMPTEKDAVVVQGVVAAEGEKLFFVAKEIRKNALIPENAKP